MKNPIVRAVAAVAGGTIAAFVVVMAIELISSTIYPMPSADRGAMADAVARLPAGAFGIVLAAWSAGVFLGVWIATRIARSWVAGAVVAIVFLGACVANLMALPHPTWFAASGIVLVLVSAAVALRLGTPPRTMRAA